MNTTELLNTVFRVENHIRTKELDGRFMITLSKETEYAVSQNAVYMINQTGYAIWKYIDGQATLYQIIKKLSDEYKTSIEVIEKDVVSMIRDFIKKGLIRIA